MALAASVLVTAGLVGGGWAYLARQRAARLMATTRVVTDALAEAERLRGQAQPAVGDLTKWSEAVSAARPPAICWPRVRRMIRRTRVTTALTVLEREQAAAGDRPPRCNAIESCSESWRRSGAAEVNTGTRSRPTPSTAAFRDFGIDLDQLDPKESGKRIAQRSTPVELASYLDDWALRRRDARGEKVPASGGDCSPRPASPTRSRGGWPCVSRSPAARLVTRYFGVWRTTSRHSEHSRLVASFCLPSRCRARKVAVAGLARAAGARRFSPKTSGPTMSWAKYTQTSVTLAGPLTSRARPEEAARFYSVAVAIRPRCAAAHENLGNALLLQGKLEEAIAEYREAVRMAPHDQTARYNLGSASHRSGGLRRSDQGAW